MMKIKIDKQGRVVNPCTQINTTVFAMQRNGTAVDSGNLVPQFMKDDDRPLNLWKDQDPMYYRHFDPEKFHQAREFEKQGTDSAQAAQNINAVLNK